MAYTLEQLGSTLLTRLSNILNGGDERVPASPDSFLTWCTPGIAFDPHEFDFAAGGFGAAADAAEYRRLLQQAFNFAQFVDFIPTFSAPYGKEGQEYLNRPSQQRLSHIYAEILRFSKVVKQELTPEQQAKLEKFRGLLRHTHKVKDIVGRGEGRHRGRADDQGLQREDGAVHHRAAGLQRQAHRRRRGVGPGGVAAVADWASNSELYWLKVKTARDAWVSGGYRNEVDQINAFIDQVTRRSLALWKQGLVEDLEKAQLSSTTPGSVFNFTTVIPGNFAKSAGWTGYGMSHEHTTANTHYENESWSAGGSAGFGLWSFGASASHSSQTFHSDYACESFGLTMELCPVLISRPWFSAEFFTSRGWTLRKGEGWFYDDFPSDGGRPPNGNMIGYSTIALFARNIVIESAEFATAYDSAQSQTSAGGSVGWGPFSLSGSYSHAEGETHWQATRDGARITVPGMQIIGFVNELVGKAPNPMEGLKDEDFE